MSKLFLNNLKLFLLYSLPAILFFSYYPRIPLPFVSDSTNYELSLPLIWLLLFSILSLKIFAKIIIKSFFNIKTAPKPSLLTLLPLLFPLYLTITILWSPNPLRAFFTSGILWCLYITIYATVVEFTTKKDFNKDVFLRIIFYSTVIICVFCWLQCFLDIFGVKREFTLLCRGCTSAIFGFPHPSGFAIEPQFMGNLLLAPSLFCIYLICNKNKFSRIVPKKILFIIFIISTLFLTFSRGAIYSFLVAFLLFVLIKPNKQSLVSIAIVAMSFTFALLAQGLFSHFSYTNDTFLTGVKKSVSQLSLGLIDFSQEDPVESTEIVGEEASLSPATGKTKENSSVFSGYVEESTNIRLNFNKDALSIIRQSPKNLVFGFGLGSAGTILYEQGKTASKKEIIQNEYFSLLLETGILGLALCALALIIALIFIKNFFIAQEAKLLYLIILAFALSLNFFSGLPNALQVYLFPVFIYLVLPKKSLDLKKLRFFANFCL